MTVHFPTRGELERSQLEQLRRLLSALLPANRFYAEKLSRLNDVEPASLEDFSTRFPFTTKQELVEDQRAHPPFGANLTFPLEHYTRFHQTSGTTGAPLRWLDTPESWQWMLESWKEVFRAANIGTGERVYFAFSFGPFIGFWLAFEAAQQLGCLCLPGGGLGSQARLRAILDNDVTVLCCTPTYALRLAEVAGEMQVDLRHAKIKTLLVAGEPGGSIPATRERLQQLWPTARVFDHHGMTEVGPVTYECPKQPGILHIIETAYFAEIIQRDGSAAARGDTGELVLTTLGRAGSPLLRYRTGDLVRAGTQERCACGRSELALHGGILGRSDDMVIVRGFNIYPAAVEDVMRRFDGVAEYQVRLESAHGLAELTVKVELLPGSQPSLCQRIQDELQSVFSLRIPVQEAPSGTLPRFEMKAKRWVRG